MITPGLVAFFTADVDPAEGHMMHRMNAPVRCALLMGALGLASCYSYPVTPLTAVPAGTRVRVFLTRDGSESLTPLLGTHATAADGALVAASDTAVVLNVTAVQHSDADESPWHGDQLVIPSASIERIGTRHLDRFRTGLTVASVIGAAFAGQSILSGIERTISGGGGGGTPSGK